MNPLIGWRLAMVVILLVFGQGCQGESPPLDSESENNEASEPGRSPDLNSPNSGAVVPRDRFSEPPLTVATGEALPPLTVSELEQMRSEAAQITQSWFDLAGLNKLIWPPVFSEELQDFRARWDTEAGAIAPFLGLWHNDGGAGQIYTLSIFPADTPSQVCVLEYRPGWKVIEDVLLEPIFALSTATVVEGDLLGSRLRSTTTASRQGEFFTGDAIALLDVVNTEQKVEVLALKSPPILPAELSDNMTTAALEALPTMGCTIN